MFQDFIDEEFEGQRLEQSHTASKGKRCLFPLLEIYLKLLELHSGNKEDWQRKVTPGQLQTGREEDY